MPDDLNKLIETAKNLGGHKTKKVAVTAALEEYVLRRKRQQAVEAFGTIDFDPTYDYKADRKRRHI
jgi:putative antitoxin of VapBC-like toxin-antitoxin system